MAKWRDPEEWRALLDGSACWVCGPGRPPGDVIAETATTWITTRREVACRGYLCVYLKRHAVEPHELDREELTAFFADAVTAGRAVAELLRPVKLNYEIHGNTNPHLHLHVFPRYVGDAFEDGPIRAGELRIAQSEAEIARLAKAVRTALTA